VSEEYPVQVISKTLWHSLFAITPQSLIVNKEAFIHYNTFNMWLLGCSTIYWAVFTRPANQY